MISTAVSRDCEKPIFQYSALAKQYVSCRLLALHDSPPFSDRPSLTGHCGHGWTCSLPRPIAIYPLRTSRGEATYLTLET